MSASASQAESGTANASVSQRSSVQTFVITPGAKPADTSEPAEEEAVSAPITVADATDASSESGSGEDGELTLVLTDEQADNDETAPALPESSTATLTDVVASNVSDSLAISSQLQGLAVGGVQVAQQTASTITANLTQTVQKQVQGSANQLVQQAANAEVQQNVNQAVNAEVTNTVRNSLRLTTGL